MAPGAVVTRSMIPTPHYSGRVTDDLPAPAEPGSTAYRRLLAGLFLAGVATFAQLYSPQGLLPLVSADLGVPAHRAALLVSAGTLGLAVSVVPWSLAGDRWGRRPVMVASLITASALALAGVLMPSLELLLVMRLLEGMAHGGVAGLAVTLLAEEVAPRVVPAAAGTYVAGTTLGGLSGRLLALPVAEAAGWRAGMLAVTAVGVACALGFLLVTPRARRSRPVRASVAQTARRVRAHLATPSLVALYLQGALLMGGFVALYNYVGYTLLAPPFSWPPTAAGLVFLAYLAGTWSSPWAGRLAMRVGRLRVLAGSAGLMAAAVALTLVPHPAILVPALVVATGSFFAAHAVASGWAGTAATTGRAQSTSLYNLAYYAGSSLFGWLGGLGHEAFGWPGTVLLVVALALTALAVAVAVLRGHPEARP